MSRLDPDSDYAFDRTNQPHSEVRHDRSHQGQQMDGCTCDDCQETRARLKRDLKQAVIERAKRAIAAQRKAG
jgi:hypothetical protein